MSLIFSHLVTELTSDSFKDTNFKKISKDKWDIFLKEYVFEKLKGKTLGESFAEKFKVQDRVLYMFTQDDDAIAHITYCKYIE